MDDYAPASSIESAGMVRARQAKVANGDTVPPPANRQMIEAYYQAQVVRRPRYERQLAPGFQAELALYHAHLQAADCDFYHTVDLPDGRHFAGAWDLRGHEDRYLGGAILGDGFLRGKKIAEFGPATGALTAHMAKLAADVTIFDLPFGAGPELVPFPEIDMVEASRSGAVSMGRLRNSWWYVKAAFGYRAQAVYADIYNLPADLPRFDVGVFGALLLHLSNPFRALQQAAAIVDDTLIVTEVDSAPAQSGIAYDDPRHPGLAAFNEGPLPSGIVHWWSFSPRAIMRMMERLGFADIQVDKHVPVAMADTTKLFTVVGRRQRPTQVQVPAPASAAVPLPPPEARFLVAGTDQVGEFLRLGRQGFDALSQTLGAAGIAMNDAGTVLDFGCGVARVLRYWADFPRTNVHGTDYQPSAIEWCKANLPFAEFATNTMEPRLAYPDETFDVIYSLSVFTHLPVDAQVDWLRELLRTLKPGGVLYFTTHGTFYAYLLDEPSRAAFEDGKLVVTGGEQPGTNFCASFHPPAYVLETFVQAHGLTLVEHIPCGAKGNPNQDSWLVRKEPGLKQHG